MKTECLFTGILCLFVASEFMGCSDHQGQVVTPGVNRARVKTITQVTGTASVSMISAFSYDVQGRLNLITAYQLPDSAVAPVENTMYQYDSQSRLIQVRHTVVRRGANSETYTLTYNSANQVAELSNSLSTFSISPQYNLGNVVTGYSKGISVGGR
ncbi:hypothetical protein [Spirosoma pomorum]